MSKLEIKGNSMMANGLTIALDGMPLKSIRSLRLELEAGEANTVAIRFFVDEIDVDAEALAILAAKVGGKDVVDEMADATSLSDTTRWTIATQS